MIYPKNRLYFEIKPLGPGRAVSGSCLVPGCAAPRLGALAKHGLGGDCWASPLTNSTSQARFFHARPVLGLSHPPIFTPLTPPSAWRATPHVPFFFCSLFSSSFMQFFFVQPRARTYEIEIFSIKRNVSLLYYFTVEISSSKFFNHPRFLALAEPSLRTVGHWPRRLFDFDEQGLL